MAEEDVMEQPEGEEAAEEPKKKGGIPMIVIIIAVAVLVGVGGFFAGQMLSGGDDAKNGKDKKETVEKKDDGQNQEDGSTEGDASKDDSQPDGSSSDQQGPALDEDGKVIVPGLLSLDAFTVNLNDPFGRRYAEVLLKFKIEKKEMVTSISENELVMPQVRDEIFMIISSKSFNELKSMSGKITLKEEIMMRVNEILKNEMGIEPVKGVYFSKFLIQ